MGLIRILLAVFVVLYHCGQFNGFKMMQGPEAVQSFYIISGFYMALILNEKYVSQVNAYKLFITNRLLKLMPVYWIIIFFILIISLSTIFITGGNNWAFFATFKNQVLNIPTYCYLIVSNLFMIGQDVALFMGLNNADGHLFFTSFFQQSRPPVHSFMLVPQAWTISIEIMFYLIAPFIVRKKFWVIILFTMVTAGIKYLLFRNGLNYDPWSYRFFPAEMFFFLLGILSYKLYNATEKINIPKWVLVIVMGFTIAVILLFDVLLLQFHQYVYFLCFALAIPFIFRFTQKNRLDRVLGEYSYPLYITHVFFKSLYYMIFGVSTNVSIPVICAGLLFSFLYNHFLNRRLEDYRQKRVVVSEFNTNKIIA